MLTLLFCLHKSHQGGQQIKNIALKNHILKIIKTNKSTPLIQLKLEVKYTY